MTHKTLFGVYCIIIVLFIFCLTSLYSQTSILGSNTYSPILVTYRGGAASGFYWFSEASTYLATAKHVLVNRDGTLVDSLLTLTSYSPGKNGSKKGVLEINLVRAQTFGELRLNNTHDVAIIRVSIDTAIGESDIRMHFLPYVMVKTLPDSGLVGAKAVTLFESTIVSNDAFILGYPGSIGVPNIIPQLDYSQPLVRRGIVAGKNLKNRTIIIDCPAYPGNSGGPVFEVDYNDLNRTIRLIGLVSAFIPFEEVWLNQRFGYENHLLWNSGYCVVEPIDYVIELAK